MYVPQHFSQPNPEALHDLIRAFPLATIVTNGTAGLTANHIPLTLRLNTTSHLLTGHVNRINPIVKETPADSEVLCIFHGPQMYITPSWYDLEKEKGEVVPTWNYVVVHAHGTICFIDDANWLHEQLNELVAHNEAPFKNQWKMSDAPTEFLDGLSRGIIGIEIKIARMQGQWKVSQNQPEYNREGVVKGLTERGNELDITMAKLIHENPPFRR